MKQKLLTLLLTAMMVTGLFAQTQKNWIGFNGAVQESPKVEVVSQDNAKLILDVNISGMMVSEEKHEGTTFQRLELIPYQTTKDIGKAELPTLTNTIGIPDNRMVKIRILEKESVVFEDYTVYPFQTPTVDVKKPKAHAFAIDNEFYAKETAYPASNATIGNVGIWRDLKVAGLQIVPFEYNAVSKELTAYTHLKIEVEFYGTDTDMPHINNKSVSPTFYKMYEKSILNFESLGVDKAMNKANDDTRYLIITNTEAVASIQPLVDWKNRQGYKVEVKTLETGFDSPQNFKDYISNLYTNEGVIEYVLMVGDAYPNGGSGGGNNIVPMFHWAPSGEDASYSDSWFVCMDGVDDHYADLAIGRFVYDNLTELELQIQKTMDHYLAPDATSNWAENSILIAHSENYPDKYTACCEEIRTFSYDLQTPIFTTAYGGAGATNSDVVNFVNTTACGIFNYRGHGSATELYHWSNSGSFTNTHVQQLTNDDKLFVFFDVCCDNMDIVAHDGDCLCESFMKSDVAAVAANGAIIPSYTIPNHDYDKEMYKAVFHEGITNIGYVTNFANLTVLNAHGNLGRSNVRTYLWLGDASIEPWTKQPEQLTVTHDPQLFLGLSEYSVSVSDANGVVENAFVCVSNADQTIYGYGYTDASGDATITFDQAVTVPGDAMVTVTKFNHLPYMEDIVVIPQSGPYVVKDVFTINDASGNNNGELDFGESVQLSLTVKNVGLEVANNVDVTISTTDVNVTITDATENYGNIAAETTAYVENGFAFSVVDDIENNHKITFTVEATDGSDTWSSTISMFVNAPELAVGSMIIDDASTGNGDGILDPGETADLTIVAKNNGDADVTNANASITSTSSDLTIHTSAYGPFNMDAGAEVNAVFTVTAAAGAVIGTPVDIAFELTAGENDQYSATDDKELVIGFVPEYCEAGSNDITDEFISRVQFVDIDNSSSVESGGYSDYTSISTDVAIGQPNLITITNGHHYAGDQMGCWIDWNYDGDFDDANETITISYSDPDGTATITAPNDARVGPTTMRLRVMYSGTLDPCGNASYGEVEDYTLNVIAGAVGGTATADPAGVCAGSSTTITLAGYSGDAIQWQESANGTTWTDISGASNNTYTTPNLSETTYYRAMVSATGYDPAYSNELEISVYAEPVAGFTYTVDNMQVSFSNTSENADTYAWEFGDGTGTSDEENPTYTYTADGDYTVVLTASNAYCPDNEVNETVEVLGIVDNLEKYGIEIYPNPNQGIFTISTEKDLDVSIIDFSGKVVYQQMVSKNTKVDISDLSAGVYFVRFTSDDTIIHTKIIKE